MKGIRTADQFDSPITPDEIRLALSYETGSLNYWKVFPSDKAPVITDGVKRMIEMCNAFWLVNDICAYQTIQKVQQEPFQVWVLTINESDKAKLSCDDGNNKEVMSNDIAYTDFPLPEGIRLFLDDGVIMLPSEY